MPQKPHPLRSAVTLVMDEDGTVVGKEDYTGSEATEHRLDALEKALQVLAWENGGSLVVTRQRFDASYAAIERLYSGRPVALVISLNPEHMVIEFVDLDTDERLGPNGPVAQ